MTGPFRLSLVVAALAASGCSEGSSPECEEGWSRPCQCEGGVEGEEVCGEDGAWGDCRCPGSDGDADIDVDTDADVDSDSDVDTDVDGDVDTDVDTDADVDGDADADVPPEGSVGCASGTGVPVSNETRTITSGSASRTFILDVPSSYAGDPTPLVLNFHGLGSNARQQRTYSGMAAKAEAEGFIAVHPEGLGANWEIMSMPYEDTVFVEDLLDALEAEYCIDLRRVYSAGMSNGAYFSHALGCVLNDRLAAIAPVAGGFVTPASTCGGAAPMPVMQVHGTADTIVGIDQGVRARDFWIDLDGCTGDPVVQPNGCELWSACSAGTEVQWCALEGVDHLGVWRSGFPVTDEIWIFFQRHHR